MNIYSNLNKSLCEIFDIEFNPNDYHGEPDIIPFKRHSNSYLGIWTGQKHTEETKKLLSQLKQGFVFSEQHRKKLRDSARITKNFSGRNHSEETKNKMSESAKNRTDRKKLRCSCIICHKEISNNHVGLHYQTHR